MTPVERWLLILVACLASVALGFAVAALARTFGVGL